MDERLPLVFIDREGKPGGGKGLLISRNLTFTLSGLRQHLMTWEEEDGLDADDGDDPEGGKRHCSVLTQPGLQGPPPS